MLSKKTCTPIINPNIKQADVVLYINTKYPEYNIDWSIIAKIWQNRSKWLTVLTNTTISQMFHKHSVLFPMFDKAMQI
ncbi:hypothetical protein RhiirB3_456854 [Rhizophagus irregularis]|nr:hypothetical protein RhiirB3_456854 [Rhizophagus irregularis]